ncbi:MAG TPA: translation initiation factor IF-2 N-terminal domain-containing protein, partial [Candidatus Sulfotelmatobacter sp.]|nr:translation initiation factor IF-2 N-terminal domain-containing protein [Candidatus Sulfotelmatobacter sp.]
MPVRIYDISKKLGLENKEVLAKAKELGIAAARVASSSLDKITAEYLEQQLLLVHPERTAPPAPAAPAPAEPPPPPTPPPVPAVPAPEVVKVPEAAPVVFAPAPAPTPVAEPAPAPTPTPEPAPVVSAPPPAIQAAAATEVTPIVAPAPEAATTIPEPEVPKAQVAAPPAPPVETPVAATPPPAAPAPAAFPEPIATATPPPPPPAPPAPPAGPKVGDKVGFIKLPPKPGPKVGDKVGSIKLPPRPEPRKPEFPKRGDMRTVRGAPAPAGPAIPGNRFGGQQKGPRGAEPAAKFALPADAQVISIKPPIVVRELADQLKQKPFKIIADLMELGVFANVNQAIEEAVAQKVCAKYGYRFEVEKRERGSGLVHAPVKKVELDVEDKPEELTPRAPVVTI